MAKPMKCHVGKAGNEADWWLEIGSNFNSDKPLNNLPLKEKLAYLAKFASRVEETDYWISLALSGVKARKPSTETIQNWRLKKVEPPKNRRTPYKSALLKHLEGQGLDRKVSSRLSEWLFHADGFRKVVSREKSPPTEKTKAPIEQPPAKETEQPKPSGQENSANGHFTLPSHREMDVQHFLKIQGRMTPVYRWVVEQDWSESFEISKLDSLHQLAHELDDPVTEFIDPGVRAIFAKLLEALNALGDTISNLGGWVDRSGLFAIWVRESDKIESTLFKREAAKSDPNVLFCQRLAEVASKSQAFEESYRTFERIASETLGVLDQPASERHTCCRIEDVFHRLRHTMRDHNFSASFAEQDFLPLFRLSAEIRTGQLQFQNQELGRLLSEFGSSIRDFQLYLGRWTLKTSTPGRRRLYKDDDAEIPQSFWQQGDQFYVLARQVHDSFVALARCARLKLGYWPEANERESKAR